MKHNNKIIFLIKIALILIICINNSNADIPTHCLKSQINGKWIFKRSPASEKSTQELYSSNSLCGHKLPSNEATSITATSLDKLGLTYSEDLQIELKSDDTAVFSLSHQGQIGKWTMVYDEGFDVTINKGTENEISYFAFLKYDKTKVTSEIKSNYSSYCYVTLVGWYHIGKKWGCFQGHKILENKENYDTETNGEAENKQNITEDSIADDAKPEVSQKQSVVISDSYSSPNNSSLLDDQLNIYKINSESDINNSNITYKTPQYINNINKLDTILPNTFSNFKFTETQFKEKLTLHSGFKDHTAFVDRINASDLTWTATVYKEFEGKTIKDLNSFAGKKKSRYGGSNDSKAYSEDKYENNNDVFLLGNSGYSTSNKKKNFLKSFLFNRNKFRNLASKSVDMSDLMGDIRSQGSCGSCFAASTLTMLEARLRKKYTDLKKASPDFKISLDHVLKCSVYNQGCDGGYSYLVLKFGHELEMLSEKCYSPNSSNKCNSSCNNKDDASNSDDYNNKRIVVDDYYYVGGSYGKCDEASMIDELNKNGPFVVSFEPSYDFMHYKSGIFESRLVKRNWMNFGNRTRPEWQKVDHSVVLVGYGEEDGVKFWKLQNSWGKYWGEDGFFRMIRGKDHTGIESICEAGRISFK